MPLTVTKLRPSNRRYEYDALADARKLAAKLMLEVIQGKDPAAERRVARGTGTFAEIANRYVEEYAQKKNKSWKQGMYLQDKSL